MSFISYLIMRLKRDRKKPKPIDKYYQYLLNKDYKIWVTSDSYEGLYNEIDEYKNKPDTLYVTVLSIVYDDKFYSAWLEIRRKYE